MEKHHSSLDSLWKTIEREFPGKSLLFRGEAKAFPRTTPGSRRMIEDASLSFDERPFLLDAAGKFLNFVEEEYPGTDTDEVEMFLQHYGLPNDLIDFTDSFEIAAYFASKDYPGEIGTFAILEVEEAEKRGLHLYNGSTMGLVRPTKQRGWAFRCRPGDPSDLKMSDPRLDGIIHWFTFNKDSKPVIDDARLRNILDPAGDRWAQYMRIWLELCLRMAWQDKDAIRKRVNIILEGLS